MATAKNGRHDIAASGLMHANTRCNCCCCCWGWMLSSGIVSKREVPRCMNFGPHHHVMATPGNFAPPSNRTPD
jgi:hypothetical protein